MSVLLRCNLLYEEVFFLQNTRHEGDNITSTVVEGKNFVQSKTCHKCSRILKHNDKTVLPPIPTLSIWHLNKVLHLLFVFVIVLSIPG